ncbi:MAG: hypothetical protein ACRD63_11030, partial [Pyrinomonadaceae bacterium]
MNNSTAGNSLVTTNNGGLTRFFDSSSGGNAAFVTNDGGTFDISSLTSGGTTAGSIAGAGNYILGDKNLTTGSLNTDTTVSGIISGAGGSLTKVGTGALTLFGANTFGGGTFLTSGVLGIGSNTALGSGNVIVSGGTLQTAGTQRVINVGGNFTQTGGTLALGLGGSGDGQFDQLNVAGNADLGGTLQVTSVNGFVPRVNDRFKLVTANAVNGQFANFINPFTPSGDAVRFDLFFNPQDVTLALVQLPFASFGQTRNQVATGGFLDQFSTNAGLLAGDFGQIVGALDTLRADQIGGALNALSPQRYEIFSRIAFNDETFLAADIDSRLSHIFELSLDSEETRHGGFRITGDFQAGEFSGSQDIANSNYRTAGFTSSYDYLFGQNFVLGGLFKLGHTTADLDQ